MFKKIKYEIQEMSILLRNVPSTMVTLFAVSLITMNLLANKSITLPVDWLALDGGIIVSWISFLSMDMITKHFGPKAATQISIFAVGINLFVCFILFIAGNIPGIWSESYVEGHQAMINLALDHTISGTWYVLLGSSIAFIISAFINNFLNDRIGHIFKKNADSFVAYSTRSYISTAMGQFCDNFVFALIVSHVFFGWSLLQCVTCSISGMIVELLCEVIFSPIGYVVCQKWKKEQVGKNYFEYIKSK